MNKKILILVLITVIGSFAYGQEKEDMDPLRCSIGSSLFVFVSLVDPEPADYFILNFGYRINEKNRVFIEGFTWKYPEPMGTYGYSKEDYPGEIRAWGIGAGYQRFLWKNLFTTVQVTPMLKQYNKPNGNEIQKGFLIYMQAMVGYRFECFKKRFYIEPAYAFKFWPVDTNFPDDFADIEKGAPNYIWEPSLNFGFRF